MARPAKAERVQDTSNKDSCPRWRACPDALFLHAMQVSAVLERKCCVDLKKECNERWSPRILHHRNTHRNLGRKSHYGLSVVHIDRRIRHSQVHEQGFLKGECLVR